jgi:hypothetical protein
MASVQTELLAVGKYCREGVICTGRGFLDGRKPMIENRDKQLCSFPPAVLITLGMKSV